MEGIQNNGFGSLFSQVGAIGRTAGASARPSLEERSLRNENRDLSSENSRLRGENRELRDENRELKTNNQSLEREVESASSAQSAPANQPPPAAEGEAIRFEARGRSDRDGDEGISGELITARRAPADTAPSFGPSSRSPIAGYQATAAQGGGTGLGGNVNLYA